MMEIKDIKNPQDIIDFLNEKVDYGWVGKDGVKRIKEMNGFGTFYRTMSTLDTLKNGVGTCIEQVVLMHELLEKLEIKNKMFCTRIYKDENFNDLNKPERMHCFILFYKDYKVYHLEHPNYNMVGIYDYESEEKAINKVVHYYETMTACDYMSKGYEKPVNGFTGITTEFYEVPVGLTYEEFNLYINSLDKNKIL